MSCLVFCTFDLKNASSQDYQNVYADLDRIGLKRVIASSDGSNVVIPTTAVIGTFNGAGPTSIRDDIRQRVLDALSARRLKSEVFIIVGDNWAWGSGTT